MSFILTDRVFSVLFVVWLKYLLILKILGGCPVSMKAKPVTPQLRVPQADCFRKCSCLVSSMSYCFRGFNLGPLDDYNVQLLVPTVGSVLHTHPTGAWLPHVATDSNRVRSGPRLVTASTETKLTPERSFTSYSGQVNTQNLHHYSINK